jgi:hypothetical protein
MAINRKGTWGKQNKSGKLKMKKRGLIIMLSVILSIIFLGIITGDRVMRFLSDYLSKTEQVKANILLVEGWLPDYVIENSIEEFKKNGYNHILTTGINSSTTYFNVHSNGFLVFNTKKWSSQSDTSKHHIIEVDAFSELDGNGRAHFNLFINDSPAGDFLADKKRKKYRVGWEGNLREIDSVMIQFDNDSMDKTGDRNLYVKGISADHKIFIPYLNNSVYNILRSDGPLRIVNNIQSGAEYARRYLILSGIDSALITAVPAKGVKINRTLSSALALREWLKTNKFEIKGINIISMGAHARRTWMTYNRVLNNKYKIGIISISDTAIQYSHLRMVLKTLRETIGLLYYQIILIPY